MKKKNIVLGFWGDKDPKRAQNFVFGKKIKNLVLKKFKNLVLKNQRLELF